MGPVYLWGCVGLLKCPTQLNRGKSSYLLFGMDCHTPTEAAFLPPKPLRTTEISDYREEMVMTLSSARTLALKCNQKSQRQYKQQYGYNTEVLCENIRNYLRHGTVHIK